jgi:hemerythrin
MIQWDAKYEVGIRMVDEQHKELVDKINELQTAMREGKGRDKISAIVNFLGGYALKHFATEESLMRLHNYPHMARHVQHHEDFKADFARLQQDFSSDIKASLLAIEVQKRLSDWLLHHIQKVDKETAHYLALKGAR